MKTLATVALAVLSLNSFASLELPNTATKISIVQAGVEKVATAFKPRECTEYDSPAVDCADPIAFKQMVRVTVGYIDSAKNIDDADQYEYEMFEVSDFSYSELQSIRRGNTNIFKIMISSEPRTFEDDICNDEYGCVNGDNYVHSSYNTNVKLIEILKK